MSPASNVEPAPDKDTFARGIATTMGLAFLGVAVAVAAFLAALWQLRVHHAGFGLVLVATAVYGLAVVGIAWGAVWIGRRNAGVQCRSVAQQRYMRRMLIAQLAYVMSLVVAVAGYKLLPHGSPLMWAAAVLPAIPIIGWIGIMAFYFREETDEFERSVQTESALWATGGIMALATVWGFLEMFDLAPHIPAWAVFPAWAALIGPAQIFVRRRYR
jgi:hypothetical protein